MNYKFPTLKNTIRSLYMAFNILFSKRKYHLGISSHTFLRAGATNGADITDKAMAAPPVTPTNAIPVHFKLRFCLKLLL